MAGATGDSAVSQLVDLGLTTAQSRAYVTLLEASTEKAAEVAAQAGLSRTKVYEVLQTLEAFGFVTSESEQRAIYRAVDPAIAIPQWIESRERRRRLDRERDDALGGKLIDLLPRVEASGADEETEPFEPVIGNARSSAVLPRLAREAQTSLDIMQMPPFIQPRTEWNMAEGQALARGIRVRILNSAAGLREESRLKEILNLGAEVRVEPEHPLKVIIRDEVEAAVAVRHSPRRRRDVTTLIVRQPDIVRALMEVFQRQWEGASAVSLDEGGEVRVEPAG
jgi:sugar-specific transcriptional regulator TrmB